MSVEEPYHLWVLLCSRYVQQNCAKATTDSRFSTKTDL